jgi:hypothetical protein
MYSKPILSSKIDFPFDITFQDQIKALDKNYFKKSLEKPLQIPCSLGSIPYLRPEPVEPISVSMTLDFFKAVVFLYSKNIRVLV